MNALVTGASRGIGKGISEALYEAGFNVYMLARSKEELVKAAETMEVSGKTNKLIPAPTDITSREDYTALISQIPTLDILVHNAGMFSPGKMMAEEDENFEKQMKLNFYPAYYLTKALYKGGVVKSGTHIFIMCSSAALAPSKGSGSYSVSKYAVLGLAENLREELRDQKIKVTAILPGSTYSSSWEGTEVDPARLIQPSDIAGSILGAYRGSESALVERIVLNPMKPL
jgi:3-oxoacyl-[acyl-carrier protein] reductase